MSWKMKHFMQILFMLLGNAIFFSGSSVHSLPYDYSASIECLTEPLKPQYEGGIIRNPEFNQGLKGWSTYGYTKIKTMKSATGNQFGVATSREQSHQSISQKNYLQRGMLYTFSAWVQISEGNAAVRSVFKIGNNFIHAGVVEAQAGCWSMLKGGLSVDASGPAEFYFESLNTTAEIWVDSVSLQPFTKDEWRSHQFDSIQKARMRIMRFRVVDANGNALPNATIIFNQKRPGFPFGSAISSTILTNTAYQNWFTSRFTVTVFENEMKWYSTEATQGKEDYQVPDAMLTFAKQHGIAVRGHNVLWDDPAYLKPWVRSLSVPQFSDATNHRVNSVVSRYRGQVIGWDVVNENMHFHFYEDKLGGDASGKFYMQASTIDPNTLMFLNDYNTLEYPGDALSTPAVYLRKLKEMQSVPGTRAKMAIGLEGHFNVPNIAYMRSALDTLASAKVPIWLTEVDVTQNQAQYLEQVLREGYSHPAVQGIVMWTAWNPQGCYRTCLTDNNFNNLPTGDVVDKLIAEWKSGAMVGTTDADGFFEARLFHGEYEVKLNHRVNAEATLVHNLVIDSEPPQDTVVLRLDI